MWQLDSRNALVLAGVFLLLIGVGTAAWGGPHILDTERTNDGAVLQVEATADDNYTNFNHDYTVFEEAEKVQYLARSSGERTADGEYERVKEYENMSLDEWIGSLS